MRLTRQTRKVENVSELYIGLEILDSFKLGAGWLILLLAVPQLSSEVTHHVAWLKTNYKICHTFKNVDAKESSLNHILGSSQKGHTDNQ